MTWSKLLRKCCGGSSKFGCLQCTQGQLATYHLRTPKIPPAHTESATHLTALLQIGQVEAVSHACIVYARREEAHEIFLVLVPESLQANLPMLLGRYCRAEGSTLPRMAGTNFNHHYPISHEGAKTCSWCRQKRLDLSSWHCLSAAVTHCGPSCCAFLAHFANVHRKRSGSMFMFRPNLLERSES